MEVPRRNDKPSYNPAFVDELMAEGYDYRTALIIASTEMDGAYEDEWGNIESVQTYCDELDYSEDISGHLDDDYFSEP